MNLQRCDNTIDIFAYYDRPVFFVSEVATQKYICVLINNEDGKEKWLVSEITDETYKELKSSRLDFYTCFKQSTTGKSFLLTISDEHIDNETEITSSEISDDMLPNKGVYFVRNNEQPFVSPS